MATRNNSTLTAAQLLGKIQPGETKTAFALARLTGATTAQVTATLWQLIGSGALDLAPSATRTMRVHRPLARMGEPVVHRIPSPESRIFRDTLTNYDAENRCRMALCMLVRRG